MNVLHLAAINSDPQTFSDLFKIVSKTAEKKRALLDQRDCRGRKPMECVDSAKIRLFQNFNPLDPGPHYSADFERDRVVQSILDDIQNLKRQCQRSTFQFLKSNSTTSLGMES